MKYQEESKSGGLVFENRSEISQMPLKLFSIDAPILSRNDRGSVHGDFIYSGGGPLYGPGDRIDLSDRGRKMIMDQFERSVWEPSEKGEWALLFEQTKQRLASKVREGAIPLKVPRRTIEIRAVTYRDMNVRQLVTTASREYCRRVLKVAHDFPPGSIVRVRKTHTDSRLRGMYAGVVIVKRLSFMSGPEVKVKIEEHVHDLACYVDVRDLILVERSDWKVPWHTYRDPLSNEGGSHGVAIKQTDSSIGWVP